MNWDIALQLMSLGSIFYVVFVFGQMWESDRKGRAERRLKKAQKEVDKLSW